MAMVYFDYAFKSKKTGKKVYFYDFVQVDKAQDQELKWFHVRHGLMKLYRLLQVDAENFIAQDMNTSCFTTNDNWERWLRDPLLAIREV